MKFNIESRPKTEREGQELEQSIFPEEGINGVFRKTSMSGHIYYHKEQIIDGLEYKFSLDRSVDEDKKNIWFLGFYTDYGSKLTNKGLQGFRQVVDSLESLVDVARKNEVIKEIHMHAADDAMTVDNFEKFRMKFQEKLEDGTLTDFSYVYDFNGYKKVVSFEKSAVIVDEKLVNKKILEQVYNIIGGESPTRRISMTFQEFLKDRFELERILNNPEILSSLQNHIKEYSLGGTINEKNKGKQRADLYERTLKQRFPDYRFSREGTDIVIHLV